MIDIAEAAREGAPSVSNEAASSPARKPSARILLIEDEPDLSEAIARILRGAGHRVLAVEDGLEAFFHLEKGAPDLILSDVHLPGFDGLEILQRIRANPQLASTPVIFLTAVAGPLHRRAAMNLGADDFLNKPVDRAELLHAVESRLRRSRDYREQCDARLRRQKDFVSLVAHDLRAPLTALGLGLDLATLQPGADPLARHAAESAVQSMNSLVDRLLAMARHQGEAIPFEPRQVGLRALCERAAALSKAYRSSRHLLEIRAPSGPADRAWLDPVLVEQVLCNLLSNAFKYSPDGGRVVLSAALDEPHGLRFEVADEGTGMEPEEARRVFDLAFRAPRHRHVEGNGIGLFGVKLLVERHGGRIECRSRLGTGTRFLVTLPTEARFFPPAA